MQLIECLSTIRSCHIGWKERRISELYGLIYYHYANLERLYAFAAGIKDWPKNPLFRLHYRRTIDDKRRLLWTSKNLKAQIDVLETELQDLLTMQKNSKNKGK